jgi:hypothetical protein
MKRWLYWAPRLGGLLFAGFLSLFALDVFGVYPTLGETLVALFMHMLPVFVLLAVLAIAWRWERLGAVLLVGLGLAYVLRTRGNADWVTYLVIAGPPVLLGLGFLADALYRQRHVVA